MAKIRVYELARECNMTNKELLDKLRDMDVAVKTHASSLDEETVDKVKAVLFGKAAENVVETRVRSTVIRRRKKIVAEEKGEILHVFGLLGAYDVLSVSEFPDNRAAMKAAARVGNSVRTIPPMTIVATVLRFWPDHSGAMGRMSSPAAMTARPIMAMPSLY